MSIQKISYYNSEWLQNILFLGGIILKFKRFAGLFALILALSTFFSSFAFADNNVKLNLVALGDSITYGWNLDHPNQTSPSTAAFPYLIGNGKYNVTKNISFPGWKTDDLLTGMNTPENIAAIKEANVITLDIGNNDLLQTPEVAAALSNPTAVLTPEQLKAISDAVKATSLKIATNLTTIIGAVKTVNPDAQIILYNLYNPFAAGPIHNLGEQIIPGINAGVIQPIAAQSGSVIADAYSAMNGHQTELILPNDIHPNANGHKALALAGEKALAALKPSLELKASTTADTTDPVTITVNSNAKKILALKWLDGEKTAVDFTNAGNPITDNKFQVSKNGTYTVYLFDSLGLETVSTIVIKNIKEKQNPTPAPTPAPPKPTPPATTGTGHALPDTGTAIYNYLAAGLGLVLAGLGAMKLQTFRRKENL